MQNRRLEVKLFLSSNIFNYLNFFQVDNKYFFLFQIIHGLERLPEQIRSVLGQEAAVKELAQVRSVVKY